MAQTQGLAAAALVVRVHGGKQGARRGARLSERADHRRPERARHRAPRGRRRGGERCRETAFPGVFLGSLTREKRIEFLLDASARIAARRPDFRLVVAGDGDERDRVLAAASSRPWMRYLGRVDDLAARARLLAVADGLLVPGLVGLVALDSFAAGAPLVTTAVDFHSPEIEYVRDGVNGAIAATPEDANAYAGLALEVMTGDRLRERLLRGCAEARRTFTLAAMVDRFAGGVRAALEAR